MKYLKLFKNHQDYESYITGSTSILPNISYCEKENEAHINPEEEPIIIQKLEMAGGNSLIFSDGMKSDGTSLDGFVLRTGESVDIIQGPITIHLSDDTSGGIFLFQYESENDYQYTTSSGGTYYYKSRYPRDSETITFTPLEHITFLADVD